MCNCSLCWLAASLEWARDDGLRWSLPQGAYDQRDAFLICKILFGSLTRSFYSHTVVGTEVVGLCEGISHGLASRHKRALHVGWFGSLGKCISVFAMQSP